MRTNDVLRVKAPAAALLAAFASPGLAADEEREAFEALTRPSSVVSVGVGYLTDDGPRFGQYTGVRKDGAYLLLDGRLLYRDDPTGTWIDLRARNLGLDHREVRFEHRRQGNWGYFIDFGQTPRFEPHTVITGLTGIGTGGQVINGTALRPVEIRTRRDTLTLGVDKIVAGNFDFQFRFRNEEKTGARLYGQGDNPGAPSTRFLTDPIDYTTRQWEAIAGYTTQRLQVSLGYYGTSFENDNPALRLAGAPAPIFTVMALPPSNQSHQVYLTGGYNITPTTRTSFRLAYTHQTQTEAFVLPTPTGRTDLGGRVDTLLGQIGLTAQPLPNLSLLANLRYEDRNDRTPLALYFSGITPTSTLEGINEPRSIKTTTGKVELGYRLPMGFRIAGGVEYEEKERNTFRVRSVSHRDRTDETSYRAELRRSIGETVTGAIAYVRSERRGSPFLLTVLANNTPGSNLVAPIHLADRDRDRVRLSLNWMPLDPLTIQLFADDTRDDYTARTAANLGPLSGRSRNYSVDGSYSFSEAWQAHAWYSRNTSRIDQATRSGATDWRANLRNDSDSVGVGMRGTPMQRLTLGAELQYSDITDEFVQFAVVGPAAVSPLPNIDTRLTTLRLFANYALQRNLSVRLNYIFDRWRSNDWTWTTWVYTDGTRLVQDPSQKIHFFGVTVSYQWR